MTSLARKCVRVAVLSSLTALVLSFSAFGSGEGVSECDWPGCAGTGSGSSTPSFALLRLSKAITAGSDGVFVTIDSAGALDVNTSDWSYAAGELTYTGSTRWFSLAFTLTPYCSFADTNSGRIDMRIQKYTTSWATVGPIGYTAYRQESCALGVCLNQDPKTTFLIVQMASGNKLRAQMACNTSLGAAPSLGTDDASALKNARIWLQGL